MKVTLTVYRRSVNGWMVVSTVEGKMPDGTALSGAFCYTSGQGSYPKDTIEASIRATELLLHQRGWYSGKPEYKIEEGPMIGPLSRVS